MHLLLLIGCVPQMKRPTRVLIVLFWDYFYKDPSPVLLETDHRLVILLERIFNWVRASFFDKHGRKQAFRKDFRLSAWHPVMVQM